MLISLDTLDLMMYQCCFDLTEGQHSKNAKLLVFSLLVKPLSVKDRNVLIYFVRNQRFKKPELLLYVLFSLGYL